MDKKSRGVAARKQYKFSYSKLRESKGRNFSFGSHAVYASLCFKDI